MPVGNVDYDRGVLIKTHQQTGMDVFMYADDPGKYFSAHSKPVGETLAKEAGYDVEKLAKDRVKKERQAQAMAMIDDEMADDKDIKEDIVSERNGYRIITTGLGRHHVIDPDNNRLTAVPVSLEIAKKLFDGMAGEELKKDNKAK